MQVYISRNACDAMPELGELNSPGQGRWFSPTTTSGEATLASEEVADGDSGCTRVRRLPPRQLVTLHQKVTDEYSADQPAVEDASGAEKIEREQLQRVLAILGLDPEHQNL